MLSHVLSDFEHHPAGETCGLIAFEHHAAGFGERHAGLDRALIGLGAILVFRGQA